MMSAVVVVVVGGWGPRAHAPTRTRTQATKAQHRHHRGKRTLVKVVMGPASLQKPLATVSQNVPGRSSGAMSLLFFLDVCVWCQ